MASYLHVVTFIGFLSLLRLLYPLLKWFITRFLLTDPRRLKSYGSWAMVTGATDGIGRAFAHELAKHGLNLILVSRNPSKLASVSDDFRQEFPQIKIKIIPFDFSSGLRTMGQLYSYSQPSSSSASLDITSLLEAEGQLYADQAESGYTIAVPDQYAAAPEADANDGDSHIWKWCDVAVVEELRDTQQQLRMLKDQFFETDQKVARLEKIVGVLSKKKAVPKYRFAVGVSLLLLLFLVIVSWRKSLGGIKHQCPAWRSA